MRSSASVVAALLLSACVGGPRPGGSAIGYDAVGAATWYGGAFAGRPTASGAPFDPAALTAAHRTLPLGTLVEVTALDTGRHARVLVNDRGPRDAKLLIDLSRAAADALGGPRHLARVRVRAVAGQYLPRGEKREPLVPDTQAGRDAGASAGYHAPTNPPNRWNTLP